jgi:DNA-binding MarR family transcriptional regulator
MRQEKLVDDLRLLLWKAGRTVSRHYRAKVAQLDLTAGQATALLFLGESPGSTLGGLAQGLGTDLATTSTMIDRLMSADLVRRETDRADRRRALLFPTDKALGLTSRLEEARSETAVFLRAVLGAERAGLLADLLQQLIAQVEKSRDGAEEKVGPL